MDEDIVRAIMKIIDKNDTNSLDLIMLLLYWFLSGILFCLGLLFYVYLTALAVCLIVLWMYDQ